MLDQIETRIKRLFNLPFLISLICVLFVLSGPRVAIAAALMVLSIRLLSELLIDQKSSPSQIKVERAFRNVADNAKWLADFKQPYDMPKTAGKGIFVGMTHTSALSERQPVYIKPEDFDKNHVAFIGASRTGKSKLAGLVLDQLSEHGNAVVVFDPKDDEFLPGILNRTAIKLGKPFVYVNLRLATPQINPFVGATNEEREQFLQAGLNLDPTGDPAVDFYRGEDKAACAMAVDTGADNIVELIDRSSKKKEVTDCKNFWRELRALGRVVAFHTDHSPDLAQIMADGGVIYVVGDTDDFKIMAAQKLLLARVAQIIKNRSRKSARQCTVMIDETKYMLSNTILRAIATLGDRRCNMMLAFQSYGDLEDCGSLNAKAVLGAVKNNCSLKFVYKLDDRQTADDFCAMAGEESVITETTSKLFLDGMQQGNWQEAVRGAVTVDMLTTCAPKPIGNEASVSWVFGRGAAFPLSTMHLPAGPSPEVNAAPALTGPVPANAQGLI